MTNMKLFTPVTVGTQQLKNRVVMAPMTRGRADPQTGVVFPIHAEYYAQRASAGLIVSEATGISKQGLGWFAAPGIYTQEQTESWKPVVEAVHAKGGKIALQLWHMGRQCHSDVTGEQPVSSSAVQMSGEVTARNGEKKPHEVPRPLSTEEIAGVVEAYANGAANAMKAGFDFVEIHGANGYLVDQFLQSKTNQRTDKYGGSVENRLRFLHEVVDAILAKVPAEKVGIRLSPNGAFAEMGSPDNLEVFDAAVRFVSSRNLAFLHLMDGTPYGFHGLHEKFTLARARKIMAEERAARSGEQPSFNTALFGSDGYTKETAEERLQADEADLIAFGKPFMSNPDLVERFKADLPLAETAEYPNWWGVGLGAQGLTTYPPYTASL